MPTPCATLLRSLAFALFSGAVSSQGQVWVVDDDGGGGIDFTDISSAIVASTAGDTILVKDGSYSGFTVDGKGLSIHAEAGATVGGGAPSVYLLNLPPGEVLVLRGLQPTTGRLEIENCQGVVWVEDCVFLPYPFTPCNWGGTGYPGIEVEDSSDVILIDCAATGMRGHSWPPWNWVAQAGLLAENSQVSTFGCDFQGGAGGFGYSGLLCSVVGMTDGGPGVSVDGGTVVMAGTNVTGGQGLANCSILGCSSFSTGGPGLRTDCSLICTAPPVVWSVDSSIQGGPGATDLFGASVGPVGPDTDLQFGSLIPLTGGGVSMSVSSPEREGTSFDVTLVGPSGDLTWLGIGLAPTSQFYLPYVGTIVVAPPHLFLPLDAIPPSGSLAATIPLGALAPGLLFATAYGQAVSIDTSAGLAFLGGTSALLILDSSF